MSVADHILRLLKRVSPLPLTLSVLHIEYRVAIAPLGDGEFATAVEKLIDAGMVKPVLDDLTGDTSLKITAKGIARAKGGRA